MAQKVQVLLIDDLDGGPAHETVTFGLDGVGYEIDLSSGNAGQLRDALALYVEHGRKATAPRPGRGGQGKTRVTRNAGDRAKTADIREWAKARGKKISERGRIPADIAAEYEAAH
jgi:hypothetical protein